MNAADASNRYILLPEGAVAGIEPASELLSQLPEARSMGEPESAPLEAAGGREVTVVDTVRPEGPRLVEANREIAAQVNRADAPLQMVPVVEFRHPNPRLRAQGAMASTAAPPAPAAAPVTVEIACTDAATGAGVAGAHVVAFTDFAKRAGGEGETDAAGIAKVRLKGTAIEQLYVYPPESGPAYWGGFRTAVNGSAPVTVTLTPVDLTYVDSVRHYYANSKFDDQRGVEVGVIDTGVGPHVDLNLIGGVNTVTGEPADDYADAHGHGTHVAGLIGSNGMPPAGLRGLAPGVQLRAYRVFPEHGDNASNYAIIKAMLFAAYDGCDIVNLSLGGGPHDPTVEQAISYLRNVGILVVISAGNDERYPATFPSVYPQAVAVTAMGREGTFPPGSLDESAISSSPLGIDPPEFLAAFSNVGQEVTVTGPGVGDLSTLPGDRFGPLSGTSMSAPVVSGAVACLLSQNQGVFEMEPGEERSQAIEDLLTGNCTQLGFGGIYEGHGMPNPSIV